MTWSNQRSARLEHLYQNQMLLPLHLLENGLSRGARRGMKYKVNKITEYYGWITAVKGVKRINYNDWVILVTWADEYTLG